MKNKFITPLLLVAVLLSTLIAPTAGAQTSRPVTISISGIEYDDPNFAALRETLKKNTKVKLVKSSYADAVAKLSFTYTGDPENLWDEIPKTSKQFFKVTAIDDDAITLDYTKTKKTNDDVDKTAATNQANKKDCFDCDYYPMCNYDLTKSYDGRVFHGIRKDDNSVEYYYCDNGEVIKRWDYTKTVTRQQVTSGLWDDWITTWQDYENKTASLIILKSNVPVGTTWTEKISEGGTEYNFTIEAKGIKLIDGGKTYNDVIKVKAYAGGSGHQDYYYYARNVGYVGKNLVDEQMKQRDIAGKSWYGVWKLTEDNGKLISPNETTEYLSIGKDGAGLAYYVKKKSTGKLYSVYIPNNDYISEWSFSENQTGSVLYLWFKYASGKRLDMDKRSVPKKTMIIGTKTYEYLGEKFDFNE